MSKGAPDNFAAFILSHGRADKVITYKTLRRCGYTGPIYIVIDDEDKTRDRYVELYGDQVVVFSKKEQTFDVADNFDSRRGVVYARNANFKIAKDLGYKYFIQLDDDYTSFRYRFDDKCDYRPKSMGNLDTVLSALLKYFINSNATSIAIAQGGDFIGGSGNSFAEAVKTKRKVMNSFICSVDRPFEFIGRINEDVNTYVRWGSTGKLFLTIFQVSLEQLQTQSNSGGLTEIYLDVGTYVKSFYTVLYNPSSVKVYRLRDRDRSRLHHKIDWSATVPKILRESIKKKGKANGSTKQV